MPSTPTRPHTTSGRLPPLPRQLFVIVPLVVAAGIVAVGGYGLHWRWTGYYYYDNDHHKEVRDLWDWLTLLVLPLTIAVLPLVADARGQRRQRLLTIAAAVGVVFGVLVVCGYVLQWTWTGFPGNTLWDWLNLFLVPFAVPLAFSLLKSLNRITGPSGPQPDNDLVPRPTPPTTAAARDGAATLRLLLGSAVLLTLLAAAYSAGQAGAVDRATTPASTPPGTSSWLAERVTVDGRTPTWTDTHLSVHKREVLEIQAVGEIKPGKNFPWVGPDGLGGPHRVVLQNVPHEALIAMVGSPRSETQLTDPPPADTTLVGSRLYFRAASNGDLYLAPNDPKTEDNLGSFTATITQVSP